MVLRLTKKLTHGMKWVCEKPSVSLKETGFGGKYCTNKMFLFLYSYVSVQHNFVPSIPVIVSPAESYGFDRFILKKSHLLQLYGREKLTRYIRAFVTSKGISVLHQCWFNLLTKW